MQTATFDIEKSLWDRGFQVVCGVDEVGRGCFAGPVVVGAVVFPPNCSLISGIADSKLLSAKKREELNKKIKELALCWAIAEIEVSVINEVGIGKATQLAFKKAVESLSIPADFVIIDAFYIQNYDLKKQMAVKGGDKLSASIAAASIIAKVYRDELMYKLDSNYPGYGFASHKGYGTKFHQDALREKGLSEIHRRSFDLSKFLTP